MSIVIGLGQQGLSGMVFNGGIYYSFSVQDFFSWSAKK